MYNSLQKYVLSRKDLRESEYPLYDVNSRVKRSLGSDRTLYQGSKCEGFFEVRRSRDDANAISMREWTIELRSFKNCYTLLLSGQQKGLIIGKGGVKINALTKDSGANILLDGQTLKISGNEESVKLAMKKIGKLIGMDLTRHGVYGEGNIDLKHGCNQQNCNLRGVFVKNEMVYCGDHQYVSFNEERAANVMALDTEMVSTSHGMEVVEIAVVDEKESVVYATKVAPTHDVYDYRSKFSGFTSKDLQGVTKTLKDVQDDLREIINYNTIIVGHSLENDLRALKIVHDKVVDTNHELKGLFPRPPRRLYGLSLINLYKIHVGSNLYLDGETHQAAKDANACLQILKKRLAAI